MKFEFDDEHGLNALEIKQLIKDNERVKMITVLEALERLILARLEFKSNPNIGLDSIKNLFIAVDAVIIFYSDYRDYCRENMEM